DAYVETLFDGNQVVTRVGRLLTREAEGKTQSELAGRSSIENMLFDRATGLPTVRMVIDRVKEILIEQSEIGIVFIDIEQFESIEAEYGWAFFDEFLRRVGEAVSAEAKARFTKSIVSAQRVSGSSFYAFFETRGHDLNQENALHAIADE